MMEKETARVSFSVVLALALILRLIVALGVLAGFAYLVALPYLWKARDRVRPPHALLLGYFPALAVGFAPVVMLAGVLVIRGPNYIYPAYACVIAGLMFGTIGPAMVPGLRRRMIIGLPLLLGWAYLSVMMVIAGGGMPARIDSPMRVLINAFS